MGSDLGVIHFYLFCHPLDENARPVLVKFRFERLVRLAESRLKGLVSGIVGRF